MDGLFSQVDDVDDNRKKTMQRWADEPFKGAGGRVSSVLSLSFRLSYVQQSSLVRMAGTYDDEAIGGVPRAGQGREQRAGLD